MQEQRSILDTPISCCQFKLLPQMLKQSSTWIAKAETKQTLSKHKPTHSAEEMMIKKISYR